MITDWKELGKRIGSIQDGREVGGDHFALIALQEVLGQQWIEAAIEHIVAFKAGAELAMNCLQFLRSEKAVQYAYHIYKSSSGERASQAVWLIKQIAHPVALEWVEEFLNDDNVMGWGVDVLDQLLWAEEITFDARVEQLLSLAESKAQLKGQVDFIREYIRERNVESR